MNRRLILSLLLFSTASLAARSAAQNTPSDVPMEPRPAGDKLAAAPSEDPAFPMAADPAQDRTAQSPAQSSPSTPDSPKPKVDADAESQPRQTKRILGIIPNYRAVTAGSQLPPISPKGKFWLATQDSFDYSNFIFVGMLAGASMAGKGEPAFGQGAAGYGRYYWHTFADVGIGNYMTEAILPTLTAEDPRYYTLGKGGVFKRTGYALSRLVITRTNSGHRTFNLSEIVGNGAAAGISNAYYPGNTNTFVKTYQHWGSQIAFDGIGNIFKEFWPEINRSIFHEKY